MTIEFKLVDEVAQFAVAGDERMLVIGTDHAAEAVTGFFTKFGDGACDLAPLSGLVKHQVRAIARHFGAPESLVEMRTVGRPSPGAAESGRSP